MLLVSRFVGDKSTPLAVASRVKIAICYRAVFTSALLLYLIILSLIKTCFVFDSAILQPLFLLSKLFANFFLQFLKIYFYNMVECATALIFLLFST